MFERYTEKARRVIFFARYEASQVGSPFIETEHLVLGLLREDKALTNRFLHSHDSVESIRKEIQDHMIVREKVSTSVDLPLSNECKRVLAYAAEEGTRLGHSHIGTEHLLLGLLREEKCFAAKILKERGIKLQTVRHELAKAPHVAEEQTSPEPRAQNDLRDLTQAALEGQLDPVVGRNLEIDASVEVLSKFRHGNLLVVGAPGVGKKTIIEGLTQRIAYGTVPSLTGKRVVVFDAQSAMSQQAGRIAQKFVNESEMIVIVGDLRSILGPRLGSFGMGRASGLLRSSPLEGQTRCIATTTPSDYKECLDWAPWARDAFRAVFIHPLDELETLSVLNARKARYESFHEVTYSEEALQCAVKSADRYLLDQALPGKALELLDAAAVRVKLRRTAEPEEVLDSQKRLMFIVSRIESAILNHEFEKARFYSEEEKKERENLRLLREKYHPDGSGSNIVGPDDVEAVISGWSEYPFKP